MKSKNDLDHALAIIGDFHRFPNIPADLVKHVSRLAKARVECRILSQLLENPDRTSEAIDRMFATAMAATGLSAAELLRATDFHWREKDAARIEAAFAEIRAVIFLREQGFQDIALLPSKGHRRADIRAKRGDQLYVVEVAESAFLATNRAQVSEISQWILAQLQDRKIAQLRETATEMGADQRAFIAIIDTENALPLNTHDDFLAASQNAWAELGSPIDLHICAITGSRALGYPPDDAIMPPWPS